MFYDTRVKRRMGDVKWQLANSWRRIGYIPLIALKLHNAPETRKSSSRSFLWMSAKCQKWRVGRFSASENAFGSIDVK